MNDTQKMVIENRIASFPGETWEQIVDRVVDHVVQVECPGADREFWRDRYTWMIRDMYFLPNSPCLRNFGANKGNGAACFVLPIEDSRRSIFRALYDAVEVQAFGGGTGFNFSALRPNGAKIKSTGGKSTGAVSFISIFDHVIGDVVMQGGVRKGANMGVLDITHPEIFEFITAKNTEGVLKNFNLSVGITDDFMKAVERDLDFTLRHVASEFEITVKARDLWNKIVKQAWKNGEPGIVFLDTINRANPYEKIVATNPCVTGDTKVSTVNGSIPISELVGTEVDVYCRGNNGNLSIRTARNIVKTKNNAELVEIRTHKGNLRCTPDHLIFTKNGYVQARNLKPKTQLVGFSRSMKKSPDKTWRVLEVVKLSAREDVYDMTVDEFHNFLANDIVVHNCGEQPLPPYTSCVLGSINIDKVWDNMWVMYDVVEGAVRFLDSVIDVNSYPVKKIEEETKRYRNIGLGVMGVADLLIRRGKVYGSDECIDFIDNVFETFKWMAHGMSAKLGKDFGIHAAWYEGCPERRNANVTTIAPTGTLSMVAACSSGCEPYFSFEYFKECMDQRIIVTSDVVKRAANTDSLVTSMDISPEDHIKMQATMQKHIDSGISKTINLPNSATEADISDLLFMAHRMGCKGLTVYRDGSRTIQAQTAVKRCPECGSKLNMIEGCSACENPECGYSACSI